MIILAADDVTRLLPMREAVEQCKRALGLHAAGGATVPLRTNIDIPETGGQALFMPASVPAVGSVGIKIVSVFPGNVERGLPAVPAQVILLDSATGMVEAMLEGTTLTRIRTGAVQGAATDLLARPDARVGALIGTGGQGAGQLAAMLAVRDLEEVRVVDLDLERARAFADEQSRVHEATGCRIVAVPDADAAVDGADVVTAVTVSRRAVLDAARIAPGCHVNGIGSYTPEMAELPAELLARADRIFVDTQDCLAEAGDVIGPIRDGLIRAEDCVDLGRLVNGEVTGRGAAEEITVFDSVGSAVLDVVCAAGVLEAARREGAGTVVEV